MNLSENVSIVHVAHIMRERERCRHWTGLSREICKETMVFSPQYSQHVPLKFLMKHHKTLPTCWEGQWKRPTIGSQNQGLISNLFFFFRVEDGAVNL